MNKTQTKPPQRGNRNSMIAYAIILVIAVVVCSLLVYVGPPFGPDWTSLLRNFFGS